MSHDTNTPAPDAAELGRRRFLGRLTAGFGALIGAAIAAGPVAMLLTPLRKKPDAGPPIDDGGVWSPAGAVARFAVGAAPERVVLKEDRQDAWLHQPGVPVGSVLVQRLGEADFRVLSATCPHLGCSVRPSGGGYLCPCHRSSFTVEGGLLPHADGTPNPAPRGLDPLEWRVRAGTLEVRWVRYRTGTADRVPVA